MKFNLVMDSYSKGSPMQFRYHKSAHSELAIELSNAPDNVSKFAIKQLNQLIPTEATQQLAQLNADFDRIVAERRALLAQLRSDLRQPAQDLLNNLSTTHPELFI